MVFRTRVIVRLGTQNRMVTKGYRKGVYDRVTAGTRVRQSGRNGDCRDPARYVSDFRQSHDFVSGYGFSHIVNAQDQLGLQPLRFPAASTNIA
jgi:hypothetical protein